MNLKLKVQDTWRTVIKVEDSSPSRGQFIHNRLTGLCGDIRNIYIYKTTFNTRATGEEVEELEAVVHSFVEFYKPASLENARSLHLNGVRMYSMTGALTKEYACVVANAVPAGDGEHPAADERRETDTVVHVADSTASKGMVIHGILTQLCGEIRNSYVYTSSDPASEADHPAHTQAVHSFVDFKEPASAARARALVDVESGSVVISRMTPALTKEFRDIVHNTLPHIISAPLSSPSFSCAPSPKSTAAWDPPLCSSSPAPTAIRFASYALTSMVTNTHLIQAPTSKTTPTAAQIPSFTTGPMSASFSTTAALTCSHAIEKPSRALLWTPAAVGAASLPPPSATSSQPAAVRSGAHPAAAAPAPRASRLMPVVPTTYSAPPSVASLASGSTPPAESTSSSGAASSPAARSDSETSQDKAQNAVFEGGSKENIDVNSPVVPSKRKKAAREAHSSEHDLPPTPMDSTSYFGEAAAKRIRLKEEADWEALQNKFKSQITVCKGGDKENVEATSPVVGSQQKPAMVEERTPGPELPSIHTTVLRPLLQQRAPVLEAKGKAIEGRDPEPQLRAWVRSATTPLHQFGSGGEAESIEVPALPPTPLSLAHTTIPLPMLAFDPPSVHDSAYTAAEEGEIEQSAEERATASSEQAKLLKLAEKSFLKQRRKARKKAARRNASQLAMLTAQPATATTVTSNPGSTPRDPGLPPALASSSRQTALVSSSSSSAADLTPVPPTTPSRFGPRQAVLPQQELGLEGEAKVREGDDFGAELPSEVRLAISPLEQLGMGARIEPIEGAAVPPPALYPANSTIPLPFALDSPPETDSACVQTLHSEKTSIPEPKADNALGLEIAKPAIASTSTAMPPMPPLAASDTIPTGPSYVSRLQEQIALVKRACKEGKAREQAARRNAPQLLVSATKTATTPIPSEGRSAFIFPSSPSGAESPISVFPVTPSRFATRQAVSPQQELGLKGKSRMEEGHDFDPELPALARPAMTPLHHFGLGGEAESMEGPVLPPSPLSLAHTTIALPQLVSEPPSVPDSACTDSTPPSESTALLNPMQLPNEPRFTPFTLQTNLALTVYGERITLDLRTMGPEPRPIIDLLKLSASERDKWITVACYYKNKRMPAAAVEVLQAMLDVMTEYGMDERSLKPAFLMLFHCETEIAKEAQRQSEHTEKALKWLQKVYGEQAGVTEPAAGNALGTHDPEPAIASASTATPPTPPPAAPAAIPIGPSHVRKLQEELTELRSANLGLMNEVSTVRAAKRLLEGDMEVERNVRRRLERQLVLEEGRGRSARAR